MLTLEIKINGVIISVIKLINTGKVFTKGGKHMYNLEGYIPDGENKPGKLIHSSIIHDRDLGLLVLSKKALDELIKKD